jgi:serine/threonine protein kinase
MERYIVLSIELIDRKPANEMVESKWHQDEVTILEIIFRIVSILDEIHRNDMIYINIKSENVLVTEDIFVKFIDFGFTNLDCEELYVGDGNI